VPTVVFGGEEYGTGSSRDWAAKGTLLLGVRAVIVRKLERIHRANLVGMGVLRSSSKAAIGRFARHQRRRNHRHSRRRRRDPAAAGRDARLSGAGRQREGSPAAAAHRHADRVDYYSTAASCRFVLREILGKAGPSVRAAA